MASLRATSPSPSALITLSIMLPLYSIPLVPKPPSSPSLLLPVFHLFPLTVYLIQSKLLHSSQASITASHNLVVCLSITPHFPPLYVGVALYHCMTDDHFTLSSNPFSSNISAPTVVSTWHFPSPAKCPFCYPFWLKLSCNYTASFTFPTFHSYFLITLGLFAAERHNVHLPTSTLFGLKFSSSWVITAVCVRRIPRPGSYVSNSSSSLAAHSVFFHCQARKDVKQPMGVWATPALDAQLITNDFMKC